MNEKLIHSEMVFNGLSDQDSSFKMQGGSPENNSFSFMQKQLSNQISKQNSIRMEASLSEGETFDSSFEVLEQPHQKIFLASHMFGLLPRNPLF